MGDYSDAKVYRIYISGLEELCYVGSTRKGLSQRLSEHKYSANSAVRYKFASAPLFEDGNDPVIECLEEVDCETREELLARERYWIDQFPECLNKKDPLLDPAERHERAKATLLRCYYAKHEERKAKHREWLEKNKEYHAEQRAAKRRENLEEAREKDRLARERRKEKIAAAKKVRVKCEVCQKEMAKNSLWTHMNTVHKKIE